MQIRLSPRINHLAQVSNITPYTYGTASCSWPGRLFSVRNMRRPTVDIRIRSDVGRAQVWDRHLDVCPPRTLTLSYLSRNLLLDFPW